MIAVRVVVFGLAAVAALNTGRSAIRTFVVPRALPVALSRAVFQGVRKIFMVSAHRAGTYEEMDRRMAFYAPASLLTLPAVWLSIMLWAYAAMYWALDGGAWRAIAVSGSSLLTLGYDHPASRAASILSVSEATVGIALLSLLIAYLPTIYSAFQRREALVGLLEARAGLPATGLEMLKRFERIALGDPGDFWAQAELWFADIQESHTSLGSLAFFRSPHPNQSWVVAAGAILDGAALSLAAIDRPSPQAQLCIRSGYVALRRIADFFNLPYDPDPAPSDSIAILRDEFDDAYDQLAATGAPMKPDRDAAWVAFAGWRVNYDAALLGLAGLVIAPPAPWSSDRSPAYRRPPITRRGLRRRQNN